MKTSACKCGNTLFFGSLACQVCERPVAFLVDQLRISSMHQHGDLWQADSPGVAHRDYRFCANSIQHQVCNWAVPVWDTEALCQACRLNLMIPDLSIAENLPLWARLEAAKRHALYTLLKLGLPVHDRAQWPDAGLAFKFLADKTADSEFIEPLNNQKPVLTGHVDGVITINLAEADPIARVRIRHHLGEDYRTLLGHFRHELGHYYWDVIVAGSADHNEFRRLFGDESIDYATALEAHYGSSANTGEEFISAYANAHPWEDWAECWAHYLHMLDTLDTAEDFGLQLNDRLQTHRPEQETAVPVRGATPDFEIMLDNWLRLSVGLNALNRSMGMDDAYPFVITPPVRAKLEFVHRVVEAHARLS